MAEMKLVMINIILKGMQAFPLVAPSYFVDDLSVEMTGPDKHIEEEQGRIHLACCKQLMRERFRIVIDQVCVCVCVCVCVLGVYAIVWQTVAGEMQGSQHPLHQRGTVDGVGLGSGVYTNMKVMKSRLKGLTGKMHMFGQLRTMGSTRPCS